MAAVTFSKPSVMTWAGVPVTDHNRSEVSISYEHIGARQRLWNGGMRAQHIANKRSFSISWENVPGPTNKTVDGFMGADSMVSFYETNPGAFVLILRYGNGTSDSCSVMFSDFSCVLVKRGAYDLWNVSLTLEEV